MSTQVEFQDDTLTVTRTFDAPREAVFDAWVAVNKVQQWWGCSRTTAVRSEIDPRVGGRYVHHMTLGSMGEFEAAGRITEFSPPERLAYTAESPAEGEPPAVNSTVTVEFTDLGGKTRVRLTHTGLVDPMAREHVPHGWTAALEKLDKFLLASV